MRSLGRRARFLAGPLAAATLLIHQALLSRPFIDDSYIFYRYAADWAHGLGPVFNRGEYVEGFSSFLWTLILAAAAALGLPPQRAATIFGTALAIACLLMLARTTAVQIPSRPWLTVLLPVVLACSPAFATYATSGMDTVLFAFVLLGAVTGIARYVEHMRTGSASGASMAQAVAWLLGLLLVRAEGPIYALALAAAAFLLCGGSASRSALRWRVALPIAAGLGSCVVVIVRELVYGALTPATVSAKGYVGDLAAHAVGNAAELRPLWQALGGGFRYAGLLGFVSLGVIIAALFVNRRRGQRFSPFGVLGGLTILIGLLTAVADSGDWMPYRRLLIPILALLILLSAWAGAALMTGDRLGSWRFASALAAVGGCVVALAAGGLTPGPTASKYEADQLHRLGDLLAASPAPVHLLTNLAGVLPYYAGPRTYVWDMLGLTDQHNARYGEIFSPQFGRTDPDYDFSRPFDLFVSNSSWDFALMLAHAAPLRGRSRNEVLLSNPRWSAIPLYVVSRAKPALQGPLQRFCGCPPLALTATVRQQLLAQLRARNAFPESLLDAARFHRFFPS